jgi:hypothetical protein
MFSNWLIIRHLLSFFSSELRVRACVCVCVCVYVLALLGKGTITPQLMKQLKGCSLLSAFGPQFQMDQINGTKCCAIRPAPTWNLKEKRENRTRWGYGLCPSFGIVNN